MIFFVKLLFSKSSNLSIIRVFYFKFLDKFWQRLYFYSSIRKNFNFNSELFLWRESLFCFLFEYLGNFFLAFNFYLKFVLDIVDQHFCLTQIFLLRTYLKLSLNTYLCGLSNIIFVITHWIFWKVNFEWNVLKYFYHIV